MHTMQEIEQRLSEIRETINTRGAEISEEEMTTLETEIQSLTQERNALVAGNARRSAMLQSIAQGMGRRDDSMNGFANERGRMGDARQTEETDAFGTVEYRRAFMAYVMRGTAIPKQYRADAFTTTADTSAGAVIPTVVMNQIIEKLENAGKLMQLVTRTNYRGGMQIPVSNVKPTASWVAERATSEKQEKKAPKSGMISFAYHKLRCAVSVSLEVDTMALSAFEMSLTQNIVDAMARAIDAAIVNGSGTGQPKGIFKETTVTGQTVEISTIGYKTLVDVEAALPEEYEGSAVWLMSKKTFMQFVGMVDSNGQPIARVDHGINGAPERYLLGRQVVTTEHAANYSTGLAANTIFGALVNLKDYILNTNLNMTVRRYEDNETDDTVTKAVMLTDGKMADKNGLVLMKKVAG